MKDLLLDRDTHDLVIENGNLQIADEDRQIEQRLKVRLLFIFGEWFLNTASGVPYYESIWKKSPNLPQVDTILKSTILGTPGILELISFEGEYDNGSRTYYVSFQAKTDTDVITFDGLPLALSEVQQ